MRNLTTDKDTRRAILRPIVDGKLAAAFLCRARHGRKSREPTCKACLAVITDANTFSPGAFIYASRAICPTHGEVSGDFRYYVTDDPTYTTPRICPKCYVDWVAAHVTEVTRTGAP